MFIEGIKNPDLSSESVKESESVSDEESMSPPRNRKRNNNNKIKQERVEISISAIENNESLDAGSVIDLKSSEMSFNFNKKSCELGDEGLSKIKKKLSLKVVIPDENRLGSVSDGNVILKNKFRLFRRKKVLIILQMMKVNL